MVLLLTSVFRNAQLMGWGALGPGLLAPHQFYNCEFTDVNNKTNLYTISIQFYKYVYFYIVFISHKISRDI